VRNDLCQLRGVHMIIVGLTHPISRNNAACLLIDGQLVAMAEEERFSRVKHAPRVFPQKAIEFCLDFAGITYDQVDYFAISHDQPWSSLRNIRITEPIVGIKWAIKQFRDLKRSEEKLSPLYQITPDRKKIVYVRHHMAHAASAYFASGFDSAIIMSLDGSGDSESGLLAIGQGKEISVLKIISNSESWGKAYEFVTEALGFRYNSEEGKTMGLAPYGKPDINIFPFIEWKKEIPTINYKKRTEYFKNLTPRAPGDPILGTHKNLAASIQDAIEKAAIQMAEYMHRKTGVRKICLAGGAALNCSMNGKLASLPWLDGIFIQPAAHDAGSALGAALYVYEKNVTQRSPWIMNHAYWGPEFSNQDILCTLKNFEGRVLFRYCENICSLTAKKLADGNIIGWFQGRSEVGPRALGNRSILGDPSRTEMKDLINLKVKNREVWRPFAPAILEEDMARYFDFYRKSPYMILAFDTNDKKNEITSAVHVDGTARPQSVSKETNPKFWQLINSFKEITGIPALLNTSFNVAKQPIVNTPLEAIETFISCGMDGLAIGDYWVQRVE
jgi:carbamoyltransferase